MDMLLTAEPIDAQGTVVFKKKDKLFLFISAQGTVNLHEYGIGGSICDRLL